MLRRIVLAVLLASAIVVTLPRLWREARYTHEMRGLTLEQRRERMMGSFYASIRRVDRELPREEPLALVLRRPADLDLAIFFNYYTYPRRTHIYHSLGDYAIDTSPKRPKTIIRIADEVRVASYEELRAERITTSIAPASRSEENTSEFQSP